MRRLVAMDEWIGGRRWLSLISGICTWVRVVILALLAGGLQQVWGEDQPDAFDPLKYFSELEFIPEILEGATLEGMPDRGFSLAEARDEPRWGDRLKAIMTLDESGKRRHWVVYLTGHKPKAEAVTASMSMYSNTNVRHVFEGRETWTKLHVYGPYKEDRDPVAALDPDGAKVSWAAANTGALSFGLTRLHGARLRMQSILEQSGGAMEGTSLRFSGSPIEETLSLEQIRALEEHGWMREDERAILGTFWSASSLVATTVATPAMRDRLIDVLSVSLLKLLLNRKALDAFQVELDPSRTSRRLGDFPRWEGMDTHLVHMDLHADGLPVVSCYFLATEPRAPLILSAGILGLIARRQDGKGPVLTLRVVAGSIEGPAES